MKRFIVAATVAVAMSVGFASSADAQIVYGYSAPRGTGVMSGGTYLAPGVSQGFTSFYSPYTGVMRNRTFGQNYLGQAYGLSSGYSPLTGMSYQRGYYQPNYWSPYGGYRWNMARRWGW